MKKVASLAVALSFVWSATGCCCSHLWGGNQCCNYGPSFAAPSSCPGGACGFPGAMAPGVYQGAYIGAPTMSAAVASPTIAVATQPTYASYRPTVVASTESLPTY